jgi:DNA helicase-2/ATP-dependent DNA helicase PcrA
MQSFSTVDEESTAVLEHVQPLLVAGTTVGLIARTGTRLAAIRRDAETADLPFTDWSDPLHHAEALRRLREYLPTAVRAQKNDDQAALNLLEQLCLKSCSADDVDGRDEIHDACAELRELVEGGASLQRALARCRPNQPSEAPVRPGLHLLNAHLGKGQEFDHVVIVGLEEGIIPDFRSTTPEALAEELRTLTVMVSRARKSLYVTCSSTVPTVAGWSKPRRPSRWWNTLREAT